MEHEHQHLGALGAWIEEPLEHALHEVGFSDGLTHFITHTKMKT